MQTVCTDHPCSAPLDLDRNFEFSLVVDTCNTPHVKNETFFNTCLHNVQGVYSHGIKNGIANSGHKIKAYFVNIIKK